MNRILLTRKIKKSLRNQGFRVSDSRVTPPENLDKDTIRKLHSTAVQHKLEVAAGGLRRHEEALWKQALAPYAEGIARALWSMRSKSARSRGFATRLTQNRKRQAKGISVQVSIKPSSGMPASCRICGTSIKSGLKYCRACVPTISRENVLEAAKLGRLATHNPEAQARRSETQRRQNAALKAWNPKDQPRWLDESAYRERVQPRLSSVIVPRIMSAISVSEPYALRIRAGRCLPHPRHWLKLANLAEVDEGSTKRGKMAKHNGS